MSWLLRHFFADAATTKAVTISATAHLVGLGILVAFGPQFETVREAPLGDVVVNITLEPSDSEELIAEMQFTQPGWKAPGITAVWYCPASQRTMQLVLINRHAEREMKRFIRSFSCE